MHQKSSLEPSAQVSLKVDIYIIFIENLPWRNHNLNTACTIVRNHSIFHEIIIVSCCKTRNIVQYKFQHLWCNCSWALKIVLRQQFSICIWLSSSYKTSTSVLLILRVCAYVIMNCQLLKAHWKSNNSNQQKLTHHPL